MSSRATSVALDADPENDLLWRFNMRRLTSEELRDSLFAVSDSINHVMYGPGFYARLSDEVLSGQSRPGDGWGESSLAERARRCIYGHVKRSLSVPLLATHDMADTDASCPVRFSSTQPTQALTMVNGAFVHRRAAALAARASSSAHSDQEQVRYILQAVLARELRQDEIARGTQFIQQLRSDVGLGYEQALHGFCVLALNLNEFVYLD